MSLSPRSLFLCLLAAVLAESTLFGQPGSREVSNWTVPPDRPSSAARGVTTMADISQGVAFVAVTPCRIIDTRFSSGSYGAPALVAGATRTFDMNAGPCTGIPENIEALSLSIAAILPPSNGFLTAWPTGTVQPTSSQLSYIAGEVVANAAIVPVDSLDRMNLFVNTGPTEVYVDVNGYFTVLYGSDNYFAVVTDATNYYAIYSDNNATLCTGTCGIYNEVNSGDSIGAFALDTTGQNYGVYTYTLSSTDGAAGIRAEPASEVCGTPAFPAGVLGLGGPFSAHEVPVIGMGDYQGVRGINTNGCTSTEASVGVLGYTDSIAIYGMGNSSITGTKSFVDPHPTDPSKVIKYVSLEGPEAGTYFRGRGRFQNGLATIDVPETFRMVTDTEGLSIQVTPIGQMATVAVQSIGLDRIVVRGSRNVEFFYTVNGVRRTFKDFNPVQENEEFRPTSSDARMASALSAEQKRLLIQNGTYRPDGTVNVETAHRLGWDRQFQENREEPRRKPARVSAQSKTPAGSR
jgi:hypothetical protein